MYNIRFAFVDIAKTQFQAKTLKKDLTPQQFEVLKPYIVRSFALKEKGQKLAKSLNLSQGFPDEKWGGRGIAILATFNGGKPCYSAIVHQQLNAELTNEQFGNFIIEVISDVVYNRGIDYMIKWHNHIVLQCPS